MSNEVKNGIEILYEDENCLVINKPAGIMVHSDGRSDGPFLTDWIAKNYPETADVGEEMNSAKGQPINRGGVVHRLDQHTSGALIIAKTEAGHASLKGQFQDRTITKRYLAFVWGEMEEKFGTIDRPIGRLAKDFRRYSAQRGARGEMREAETYWTKKFSGKAKVKGSTAGGGEEKFTLLEAEPKTGRTHQIRVHFLAINHPVVGDLLYAPNHPLALGFERLALHSRSIEFGTLKGNRVKIQAPLPEDFLNAAKTLGIESLSTL